MERIDSSTEAKLAYTSNRETETPIGLILFCKKLHTADITYLVKVSDCDSEKMGSIPIIRLLPEASIDGLASCLTGAKLYSFAEAKLSILYSFAVQLR